MIGSWSEEEIVNALVWLELVSLFCAFITLLFFVDGAPYGRYSTNASRWYGPHVNAKLSWFLQECPAFLIPAAYVVAGGDRGGRLAFPSPNSILLGAFCLHYFQRSFIYPLLVHGGKPYTLVATVGAFYVCISNGAIHALSISGFLTYPQSWLWDPRFIVGLSLFVAGMIINLHSDYVLRNLRKPGETGYKIPKGGLFKFVSSAHYFGELLEWSGFGLAGWSFPTSVMMIASFFNLFPRALTHHRWYHRKFDDYPSSRKVLIPFLL